MGVTSAHCRKITLSVEGGPAGGATTELHPGSRHDVAEFSVIGQLNAAFRISAAASEGPCCDFQVRLINLYAAAERGFAKA
ncbi:hypothetical protein [Amycolatopsis vastitatis]|uniref:hypothetical protein n=1 Tax=Amycolatopsis vastitatis TaxID=1905142 RepID=UPI0011788EEA|nr:hypothetical protein [Amycolatopsis vastitatis]